MVVDRSVPQRDHAARPRDPAADLAARALALRRRRSRRSACATSRSTRRRCSRADRDQRHDWEIYAALGARLRLPLGKRLVERVLGRLGPEAILDVGLRIGPHRLTPEAAARRPARPRSRSARAAAARPARHARQDRRARAAHLPRRPAAPRARGRAARPRDDRPPPPALEQLVAAQQRAAREGPAALHAADPSRGCAHARARRRCDRAGRDARGARSSCRSRSPTR